MSMPKAENSPACRGAITVPMPSSLARDTACKPPAPNRRNSKGELGRIMPPLHGNDPDGPFHGRLGHGDDALGQFHGRQPCPGRQGVEERPQPVGMQGHGPAQEAVRGQAAEIEIGVGDGEPVAAAVAGRAGIGPGALGPHPQGAAGIEHGQGAAARPHGVDVEHGRLHRDAGHRGFHGQGRGAVEQRDVGGGAAHGRR